jgi:hypothetical protein
MVAWDEMRQSLVGKFDPFKCPLSGDRHIEMTIDGERRRKAITM